MSVLDENICTNFVTNATGPREDARLRKNGTGS